MAQKTVLHEEHVLLGADFYEAETGYLLPRSYIGVREPELEDKQSAALIDLSGAQTILVSGAPAEAFMSAVFAGKKLTIGDLAFEPAFLGDGALASIALVARTGESEYVIWDASPRADALMAWLSFVAQVEQDGYQPYAGLSFEDLQDSFVPLALLGDAAATILRDYVPQAASLPHINQVASLSLDGHIPSVVLHVPSHNDSSLFIVFVARAQTRLLWRSFLSFPEVSPAGFEIFNKLLHASFGWYQLLSQTDRLSPTYQKLDQWKLLRASSDFIGARALKDA